MRRIFYNCLLTSIVGCCCLSSCKEEKEILEPKLVPVVLKASIYGFEADEGEIWRAGQEFGVFMLHSGTDTPVGNHANSLYTADDYSATGYLVPSGEPMYYPTDGSNVDIVAYYPYNANPVVNRASSGYAVELNLSNQKQVKADDFIHSNEGKELNNGSGVFELQLRPVLSKLVVDLMPGAGIEEEQLKNMNVSLQHMHTVGVFDLLHGVFLSLENEMDVDMIHSSDNDGSREIVVFPGEVSEQMSIAVGFENAEGETVKFNVPLNDVISHTEENTQYEVGLKVTPDGLEATLVNTSPIYILDWQNDKDNVDDEIEMGIPNLIKDAKLDKLTSEQVVKVTSAPQTPYTWFGMANQVEGNFAVYYMEERGNVLSMNFTGTLGWYKNFLGYTCKGADASHYQLTFKAKSKNEGTSMQTYVRINKTGNHFFVLKDADLTKACAAKVFELTTEWTTYVVDFDFTRTVNTIYAKDIEITPGTDTDWNNFYVAFVAQQEGVEYYIDDITLIRKENK